MISGKLCVTRRVCVSAGSVKLCVSMSTSAGKVTDRLTISVTGGGVTDTKIVVVSGGRVKVIYCVNGSVVR